MPSWLDLFTWVLGLELGAYTCRADAFLTELFSQPLIIAHYPET